MYDNSQLAKNQAVQGTQAGNAIKPASAMQVLNNELHDLIDRLRHAEARLVGMVDRAFGSPPKDPTVGGGIGADMPTPSGAVPNTAQQVQTAHGISNRIHTLLEKVESVI